MKSSIIKFFLVSIFALIVLTALSNIFGTARADSMVNEWYFPADRVIDARTCSELMNIQTKDPIKQAYVKANFLKCLIIDRICPSSIVRNPIGEIFGYVVRMPERLEDGSVIWRNQTWKTDITDAATKEWCESRNKI